MKKLKLTTKTAIALSTMLVAVLLMAFTNPFIIYQGDKFYKCWENTTYRTDTLFYPGGFTIYKTKTNAVNYDHFSCDGSK
jgi:hypothetical protein